LTNLEVALFGAGTTRNGIRATVRKVIGDLGYDPEATIASAKINHTLFGDTNFAVPTSMFCQLFAHCAKVTACQDFGMLVGAEGSLSWLGQIGFVAQNADNVGTALKTISTCFRHHDRSAVVELKSAGKFVSLSYAPLIEMEGQEQWLCGVMSCGVSFMRELCGANWTPEAVTFGIRRPENTRLFDAFFHTNLIFDVAESAILFDPAWLLHRISHAEPELYDLLLKEVKRELDHTPPDIDLELLRLVRTLIGTGQCSSEKIGELLGVSVRTLYDKFSKQGKTFQRVVDEVRFEMAKQFMKNTDMSLREISNRLDYSEVSAFTRAFHRWSGTPPASWRSSVHKIQ
jgi:AraC-like DNA-binding protein